ncbi:LysR family transcriptional regulator [Falsiroseomonas bella]|nr:LysR family transcriptional regulator [Falsiroseomonas bella]
MLEVRDLRLVQAIGEHGSLVRAARVLNTTQPALTRSLAALEAKLKGRLFERSPRGAIATDLGRAVLADAQEMLGRLERLDRYLAEVRGDQVRDLSIHAGAYLAETLAMTAAARMLPLYPRVRLRVNSVNWADVARGLHDREAPIGLVDRRGIEDDPGLEVEPLQPQPGVFVVRPGHPLTMQRGLSLPDILSYPMIFIGRVPTAVQAPMAVAREQARVRGTMHPAFPALVQESPTVALAAVRQSDAVAPMTLPLALPALQAGQVVALPWREPWVSLHPVVLRLRRRHLGEAEQAFLDLLRGVDREFEQAARDWCAAQGLSPDCG